MKSERIEADIYRSMSKLKQVRVEAETDGSRNRRLQRRTRKRPFCFNRFTGEVSEARSRDDPHLFVSVNEYSAPSLASKIASTSS